MIEADDRRAQAMFVVDADSYSAQQLYSTVATISAAVKALGRLSSVEDHYRIRSVLLPANDVITAPHYINIDFNEMAPEEVEAGKTYKATFVIEALGRVVPYSRANRVKAARGMPTKALQDFDFNTYQPYLAEQSYEFVGNSDPVVTTQIYGDGAPVMRVEGSELAGEKQLLRIPLARMLGEVSLGNSLRGLVDTVRKLSLEAGVSARRQHGRLDTSSLYNLAPGAVKYADLPKTLESIRYEYNTSLSADPHAPSISSEEYAITELTVADSLAESTRYDTYLHVDKYYNYTESPSTEGYNIMFREDGNVPENYLGISVSRNKLDIGSGEHYLVNAKSTIQAGKILRSMRRSAEKYAKYGEIFSGDEWQVYGALMKVFPAGYQPTPFPNYAKKT